MVQDALGQLASDEQARVSLEGTGTSKVIRQLGRPDPPGFKEAFGRSFTSAVKGLVWPFEAAELREAQADASAGRATTEQMRLLTDAAEWQERVRATAERGGGEEFRMRAGQMAGRLGPDLAMFAATRGAASSLQRRFLRGTTAPAVEAALSRHVASGILRRFGAKATEVAVAEALRSFISPRTWVSAYEATLPAMGFDDSDPEDTALLIQGTAPSFWEAFPKAWLSEGIEGLSERSGFLLNRVPPIRQLQQAQMAVLAKFAQQRGSNALRRALRAANFDGVFAEVGEEYVGDVMRAATGVGEWSDLAKSWPEIGAMFAVFSFPGGMAGLVDVAHRDPRLGQPPADVPRGTEPGSEQPGSSGVGVPEAGVVEEVSAAGAPGEAERSGAEPGVAPQPVQEAPQEPAEAPEATVAVEPAETAAELVEEPSRAPEPAPAAEPATELVAEQPEPAPLDLDTASYREVQKEAKRLGVPAKGTRRVLEQRIRDARGEAESQAQAIVQESGEVSVPATEAPESRQETATVREPWEMTRKEWEVAREGLRPRPELTFSGPDMGTGPRAKAMANRLAQNLAEVERLTYGVRDEASRRMGEAGKPGGTKLTPEEYEDLRDQLDTPVRHREVIEKALAEGKPVPAEVLKDYPDLQKREPARPPEAAEAAAPKRGATEGAKGGERPKRRGEEPGPPTGEQVEMFAGGQSPINISEGLIRKAWTSLRRWAKGNLTSRGHLPGNVFEFNIQRQSWIQARAHEMEGAVRDLKRSVRDEYGRKPTKAQLQRINQVLGGGTAESLRPATRNAVRALRDKLDRMSRTLIRWGVIEGDLVATVDANMGIYVNRSYQAFDDPKWAEKVPEPVRNRFKALLRSEHPTWTDEQLEAEIEALLFEGKAADTPIAIISRGGKIGSKDLSSLQRRRMLTPEYRALLGQYTDPYLNFGRSMMKMAYLAANHRFLTEVRDAGMGEFLFERDDPKRPPTHKAKIAADASEVMYPLNGLYTTPEIREAFERAVQGSKLPDNIRWWLATWYKVNGYTKFGKVPLNPATVSRNFTGNFGFALFNGNFRLHEISKAIGTLVGQHGRDRQALRDYVEHAIEVGVLHESAYAGEIADMMADAGVQPAEQFVDSKLKKAVKATTDRVTRIYQSMDDVWKLYNWEQEKRKYRGVYEGRELDEFAARIVRNTHPTYSLVPQFIKNLRRLPLFVPFASFNAEVVRTAWNTIQLTRSELRSDNAQVRRIGAQRLVGMLTAMGIPIAATAAARYVYGVTLDDDDDARELVAPWSENSELLWFGSFREGDNPKYLDTSFTNPHAYLREPILALLRGVRRKDLESAMRQAGLAMMEPWIQGEIFTQAAAEAIVGTSMEGREIDDPIEHVKEAMTPGVLVQAERIRKAATGEKSGSGREYSLALEAISLLGIRITELDVSQSLAYRTGDYNRDVSSAERRFRRVLTNEGTVTREDIREAWEKMDAQRFELYEKQRRRMRAAGRLGLTDAEIRAAMKGEGERAKPGTTQRDVRLLQAAIYEPYMPSDQVLESLVERLGKEEARWRWDEVMNLAKSRRMAAR